MTRSAKQIILRTLGRMGYHVLKARDYQALLARTAEQPQERLIVVAPAGVTEAQADTPEAQAVVAGGPADTPEAAAVAHEPPANEVGGAVVEPPLPPAVDHPAITPHLFDAPSFAPLLQRIQARDNYPMGRLRKVYSLIEHITQNNIAGDLVDCGWGDTTNLIVLAESLLHLNVPVRQLVLFDSTADPLHRAEIDLRPWGMEQDLLSNRHLQRPAPKEPEPPPAELIATGYPRERITVLRYPREPITYDSPVAFLQITSETYPANRKALDVLFSRLSHGGVIAVEDIHPFDDGSDLISRFQRDTGIALSFTQVTANFRTAIKV